VKNSQEEITIDLMAKTTQNKHKLIYTLGASLIVCFVLSLFVFSYWVSPLDVLTGQRHALDTMWHVRIPRTVAVTVVGVGMSICGLIMQILTRNKFVSPTTAGTLEGARLGIMLTLLFVPTVGILGRSVVIFGTTMTVTVVLVLILEKIQVKNHIFVPLVGIVYSGIISAIVSFFAQRSQNVQQISTALIGNFSLALSGRYEVVLITIPLLAVAYLYASKFMIVGLGADTAKGLGLNYRLTMYIGLTLVSVIATLTIIVAGIIPFLGLIVPNIVAIFMGDNIKKTLLPTAMFGGVFLLLCDIVSRLIIFPFEVPVSLTVGVLGAAIFLVMLIRGKDDTKGSSV
jgi:iron complex transport system permease protein